MRFEGLVEWPVDAPLIECELPDGRSFDLYNEAIFRGWAWRPDDELRFSFLHALFRPPPGTEDEATEVTLRLGGVRSLTVGQPSDWVPEEATQITHWSWSAVEDGQGAFEFQVGGLMIRFHARRVSLDTAPGDPATVRSIWARHGDAAKGP